MEALNKVKEFLESWKEMAYNYYINNGKEYIKLHKNQAQAYQQALIDDAEEVKNVGEYNYKYYYFLPNYYNNVDALTKTITDLYNSKVNEDLLIYRLNQECEIKYTSLINKVHKAVGEIVDCDLDIGVNGSLNGIVSGTKGKCSVKTIYAGGYNVQQLHFRTLVKIIK